MIANILLNITSKKKIDYPAWLAALAIIQTKRNVLLAHASIGQKRKVRISTYPQHIKL